MGLEKKQNPLVYYSNGAYKNASGFGKTVICTRTIVQKNTKLCEWIWKNAKITCTIFHKTKKMRVDGHINRFTLATIHRGNTLYS